MQLVFGNPIDQHLQARIFEKDNSSKIVSSSEKEKLLLLLKRKKVKASPAWFGLRKDQRRINAQNKLEKELDIVSFISLQKRFKVILEMLFTREERYLIQKNKRLTVSHQAVSDSSDNFDEYDS